MEACSKAVFYRIVKDYSPYNKVHSKEKGQSPAVTSVIKRMGLVEAIHSLTFDKTEGIHLLILFVP